MAAIQTVGEMRGRDLRRSKVVSISESSSSELSTSCSILADLTFFYIKKQQYFLLQLHLG